MTFDILIQGGTVLDGVSKAGQLADIGITRDQIKAIGNLADAKAGLVISAQDKYVAPGFIDIQNHSDSYLTLLEIPSQESYVTQGVTTIAVGHCGTSLAPLPSLDALKSVQKWHSLAGANLNWLTFQEYLNALIGYRLGVNVLSLVGHSTLRRGLLGDEVRATTPEEVKIMAKMLQDSLAAGAAGLSLGLIYAHEVDASAAELQELARIAARQHKLLSVHLRSEGGHVVDAVEEVLALAEAAGARLKISHLKIQGRDHWSNLEEVLSRLDRAYQRGTDVCFDVYPYDTSWTVLYTYLPRWAYEGGRAAILKNLREPGPRQKILSHLKSLEQNLGAVLVATSESNPAFVGKTLSAIAANQEISVEEALLNVLAATNAQVIVFDQNLSPDNLEIFLRHPLAAVGSDGAGYDFRFSQLHGLVHPRCFGTMPKFLSAVREKKLLTWAEAVKKITSYPAAKLGLKKRGRLVAGNFADVVVFDPRTVGSRASYQNPYQQADGIDYVLINGQLVVQAGENDKGLAGQILRI